MTEQNPLFDAEYRSLCVGDRVTVQTIWGDEPGVVTKGSREGLTAVALDRGDLIYIHANRLVVRDV